MAYSVYKYFDPSYYLPDISYEDMWLAITGNKSASSYTPKPPSVGPKPSSPQGGVRVINAWDPESLELADAQANYNYRAFPFLRMDSGLVQNKPGENIFAPTEYYQPAQDNSTGLLLKSMLVLGGILVVGLVIKK